MAAEHRESKAAPKAVAAEPATESPEGVPYQTSGLFPDGEDNPGPFESGEGKNSTSLAGNEPEG